MLDTRQQNVRGEIEWDWIGRFFGFVLRSLGCTTSKDKHVSLLFINIRPSKDILQRLLNSSPPGAVCIKKQSYADQQWLNSQQALPHVVKPSSLELPRGTRKQIQHPWGRKTRGLESCGFHEYSQGTEDPAGVQNGKKIIRTRTAKDLAWTSHASTAALAWKPCQNSQPRQSLTSRRLPLRQGKILRSILKN